MSEVRPVRILFVCMGNICRSPAGEAVLRHKLAEAGLAGAASVESAGTINFHAGNAPDHRMRQASRARGVVMAGAARQVRRADLSDFDLVLAMDRENMTDLLHLARTDDERSRLRMFGEFCRNGSSDQDVPDPYYGGADGFERVLDMLEDGCAKIVEGIRSGAIAPRS